MRAPELLAQDPLSRVSGMLSTVTGVPSALNASASVSEVVAPAAAPIAPLIEPVDEFGYVVPGIYRCSASALIRGLPPAPKGWQPTGQQRQPDLKPRSPAAGTNGINHAITASSTSGLESQATQTSASSTASSPPSASSCLIRASDVAASSPIDSSSSLHTQAGVLHSTLPISSVQLNSRAAPPTLPSSSQATTYSPAWAANASPTELYLAGLRLKTILFLAPEKKPTSLAAWCETHRIRLVHLGLGALADDEYVSRNVSAGVAHGVSRARGASILNSAKPATAHKESDFGAPADEHRRIRVPQTWWELHGASTGIGPTDKMSLERIAKDSIEILLDRTNLPCLVCDMTGVNETGIVVGCLRRMQHFNFASVRLEYRSWAGSRSRASHERFIEMFDTDLICTPTDERLPIWYLNQVLQDDEDDNAFLT